MITLFVIVVTAAGQLSTQTLPFSSEKVCQTAANKLTEKTDKDVKVMAVCIDRGLSH